MLTIVSRKPIDTCNVSAVPTACASTLSVTSTENCAESAITNQPQTSATGTTSHQLMPYTAPIASAQLPLTAMETVTSHSRPRRSDASPPQMHPAAPTAITANAIAPVTTPLFRREPLAAALAASHAGIHVQKAYSSHMWPR